jgi:acetyl-CoA C-acetyltransferase
MREVVIVDAVRSPIGKRNGALKAKHAADLLGDVLLGLVTRTGIDPATVDQAIGGCVNQLGMQASNVMRNAWLGAGLPLEVPAVTVNIQCGSSQESMSLAHALIAGGQADVAVAGGVESLSRVPMGSPVPTDPDYGQPRGGRYLEHFESTTQHEGAERIAEAWGISRADVDALAKRSQDLAARAWEEERFATQIIPIDAPVLDEAGAVVSVATLARDEGLRPTTLEGLSSLRVNLPDRERCVHTAGNSSQISDGASAALVMSAERADALGLTPRARLVESVLVGSDPEKMLTGPIPATRLLLERTGLSLDDIDVVEINEAFASVVLAWQRELGADLDKVNVNGGAIALGHPLGATGTMLVAKALSELERMNGRYGLITMCCGGGLGTGTIIERL